MKTFEIFSAVPFKIGSNVRALGRGRIALIRIIAVAIVNLLAQSTFAGEPVASEPAGWITNGPAVFALLRQTVTSQTPNFYFTNRVFNHYLPESLSHLIWTNFTAHTNGRSMRVWRLRSHPTGWPTNAPLLAWNRSNLMWGMKGMTGISPCWSGEGSPGQVPITALTRRHGYTRGHGMGPEGLRTNCTGCKVWFLTAANERVEATIARAKVRLTGGDYTIFLFRKDLPASIEPLRVVALSEVFKRYPFCQGAPRPCFKTEQLGNVSSDVPGLWVDTWKGGDSGSPNMLPLANELVFCGGRGTSGPSETMQSDMDELCRLEGLHAREYQLHWVDLSKFPAYETR